jgi:hypothetical protein
MVMVGYMHMEVMYLPPAGAPFAGQVLIAPGSNLYMSSIILFFKLLCDSISGHSLGRSSMLSLHVPLSKSKLSLAV